MKKIDLLELIKDIDDNTEVNEILQSVDGLIKPFDVAAATIDDYKNMLANNKVIKAYYQSAFDSAVSIAVNNHDEKFKKEKLPTLIAEAVKKETTKDLTPEQQEIKELKEKMAEMVAKNEKAEKLNANTQLLKANGLPIEFAKLINSDSDLELIKDCFSNAVKQAIKEKLGTHDETPPTGGSPREKMTLTQIMAYCNEHPEANMKQLIEMNR